MNPEPNFNPIARPYRWLEYLTLGRALERCRLHFLPKLLNQKKALVIGDGDGRFLAALMAANLRIHVDAVDSSATMLQLLRQRCEASATRLETHHTSALSFAPTEAYDLVVTHFFLDCLTQSDVEALIDRIAPTLTPDALWLISDFRIPEGHMRLPARILVRSLYLAFRIITGLRTTHLPDYASPLAKAGLTRLAHHHSLAGLLTTELWQIESSPIALALP
ncbi:MAG TPA: class I SAM-dependent methyltransferase [Edaphobacter sp.]|uniref:class I SAM-dependent methyltransferase n=1 Tax=Edaphobacter sp. TaxID=1934404 RepID=UPI002C030A8A|nr:class I SAM-dependent methyltransferase [Edaphobacter sp.]HUZ95160.1 class I SAM-dependent methyltransferase [Edaphobacter sp.]